MTTKQKLLCIFEENRGEVLSGELLAKKLNISRAAVWKAIKALQQENHEISSAHGNGYIMQNFSNVLTQEGVLHYLNDKNVTVLVKKSVSSTNILAKDMAANGACHGSLVVADMQTAGRGRLGRQFSSPAGTGLYLTCILKNNMQITDGTRITVAAAVAVCRSLKAVCNKNDIRIKWVNDLYIDEKKCGGILCEASADIQTGMSGYVVVGIGLNLFSPSGGFEEDIQHIATSIFSGNEKVLRNKLAAEIANELIAICDNLHSNEYMDEYKSLNMVTGRNVTVLQSGKERHAHAKEILDDGSLLVRYDSGEDAVLTFGEVSLRI